MASIVLPAAWGKVNGMFVAIHFKSPAWVTFTETEGCRTYSFVKIIVGSPETHAVFPRTSHPSARVVPGKPARSTTMTQKAATRDLFIPNSSRSFSFVTAEPPSKTPGPRPRALTSLPHYRAGHVRCY